MTQIVRRALSNAVEGVCLVLMVVLAVDLMLGVFSRYVLGSTFTWYDEIARACFVWMVFLGAAVGVKRGSHFGLHLFVDQIPPHARRVAAMLTPLVVIGVASVLVVQGLAFLELGRHQQLPVTGVSKIWLYSAMPVGGALMVLFSLVQVWRQLRDEAP